MDKGVYGFDGAGMSIEWCDACQRYEDSGNPTYPVTVLEDISALPPIPPVILTAEGIGKSIEAVAEEVDKIWEVVNLLYEIHQSELKWHRGEHGFRNPEAAELSTKRASLRMQVGHWSKMGRKCFLSTLAGCLSE